VEVSDLYREGFNPVEGTEHYEDFQVGTFFSASKQQREASIKQKFAPDVQREMDRLERADLVILQFPLWWHGQPAMLRGWFDRVFVYGRIYTGAKRYDRGHFRGKRAICSVTTGGPASIYSYDGRGGNIAVLMSPINYSLYYVGFDVLRSFCSFGIRRIDASEQSGDSRLAVQEALQIDDAHEVAWAQRIARLQDELPIRFASWNDWNEAGRLKPGLKRQGYFVEYQQPSCDGGPSTPPEARSRVRSQPAKLLTISGMLAMREIQRTLVAADENVQIGTAILLFIDFCTEDDIQAP
jgi:NAD(P)H dehydrogenase (quinone)